MSNLEEILVLVERPGLRGKRTGRSLRQVLPTVDDSLSPT